METYQIRILPLDLPTGLVVELGGQQPGPLIVLRADIDALPIDEKSGVPFSSEHPGVMHACGHDFHSASALGAAILLKQQESSLPGRVRILFPTRGRDRTRRTGGDCRRRAGGATAIFGIHNDPALPVGVMGSKAGALTAGVDRFRIDITGTGSHAARPHEGNDPVVIAGQLISTLQTLISRNVPSDENAVLSLTPGAQRQHRNVIPDSARLEGTVRTFSQTVREQIEQRMRDVLTGLAAAFNAHITLDWQPGPPSVVNSEEWVALALETGQEAGFDARRIAANPIGEDFAFYQQRLPGAFIMIGSGGPYALHHPQFRVDDAALFPTAQWLATLAVEALKKAAA